MERLNDQNLIDYAKQSYHNMEQVMEWARQKYEALKSNPQCGEYLAYYGEIFALQLFLKDNPLFDRNLLIKRAEQSGQIATAQMIQPTGLNDLPLEVIEMIGLSDLQAYNRLIRTNREMRNLLEPHKQTMLNRLKLRADIISIPINYFYPTQIDKYGYYDIRDLMDQTYWKLFPTVLTTLNKYIKDNNISIMHGDVIGTSFNVENGIKYYHNLFYWYKDRAIYQASYMDRDCVPMEFRVSENQFNPRYWTNFEHGDRYVDVFWVSDSVAKEVKRTLQPIIVPGMSISYHKTQFKFLDKVYNVVIPSHLVSKDLTSLPWSISATTAEDDFYEVDINVYEYFGEDTVYISDLITDQYEGYIDFN